MNSRINPDRDTGRGSLQRRQTRVMQTRRVDALAFRQIRRQFAQAFAKLPFCSQRIALLIVMEPHREMDQRLQKQAPRPAFRRPNHFQQFVALEEFTAIEQFDSALQRRLHRRHCRTACYDATGGGRSKLVIDLRVHLKARSASPGIPRGIVWNWHFVA